MTTAILSDYLETKIINHTLRNTAYTKPGDNIHISLHTANPADDASGTEVSGTAYARIKVSAWDDPVLTKATQNTNQITWGTAGSNWGTVTHIGIWDADTAGNLLMYGELTDHKDIPSGVTFSIAAGGLDVSIGGAFSAYLAGKWIDHVLRDTAFTTPGTSVYIALYNTGPAECSGTSYTRLQCTAWDAPGATDGATENTNALTFATPGGAWGALTHTAIVDTSGTSGGNVLFGPTALDVQTYSPTTGDVVQFAAGALDVVVS